MTKKNLTYKVFTNPIYFFAFGFGSGLAPMAAGTFGTAAGVILYLLLHGLPLIAYILVTLLLTVMAIWSSAITSKAIGIHDFTAINIDEVVGFLWTMTAIPFAWYWVLLGFLLFRLFDIWKPWPIRWVDRHVGGGFGMVLDDLVAALFSWMVLWFLVKLT